MTTAGRRLAGIGAALAVLALGVPLAAAAGAAAPEPGPVALVLVPDLTWATAPPELEGFAKANLSMRTAEAQAQAADVYLTLGKGARSDARRWCGSPGSGAGRRPPGR